MIVNGKCKVLISWDILSWCSSIMKIFYLDGCVYGCVYGCVCVCENYFEWNPSHYLFLGDFDRRITVAIDDWLSLHLHGGDGGAGAVIAFAHLFAFHLQRHVRGRSKAKAGAEHILDAGALLKQRVDYWRTRRHQGSLAQVGENGQSAVKTFVGPVLDAVLYAFAHLRQNHQVEDDGCCQQRVFAGVVYRNCRVASQHQLRNIFIHCAFTVADVRNVLDDDAVVWVFTWCIQLLVRCDHVVDYIRLRDLRSRAVIN